MAGPRYGGSFSRGIESGFTSFPGYTVTPTNNMGPQQPYMGNNCMFLLFCVHTLNDLQICWPAGREQPRRRIFSRKLLRW
jgi:hypothetical protein